MPKPHKEAQLFYGFAEALPPSERGQFKYTAQSFEDSLRERSFNRRAAAILAPTIVTSAILSSPAINILSERVFPVFIALTALSAGGYIYFEQACKKDLQGILNFNLRRHTCEALCDYLAEQKHDASKPTSAFHTAHRRAKDLRAAA